MIESATLHRYLLLLGSADSNGEQRLALARDRLAQASRLEVASRVVCGPSVADGDPNRYTNQAVLLASALRRDAFMDALKQFERELGRDAKHRGVIDLDLAREYDAEGRLRWENPAKLAHPLFRALADEAAPR